MKQPRLPNFRRLAVFLVLFILLSVAFLFWARDIVREVVVLPLSYLFWVIGVLVNYLPQLFFWIILLLIAGRIALTSLSRKKKENQDTPRSIPDPANRPVIQGRVAFWVSRVEYLNSGRGEYFTSSFHSAVGKMLLDLIAYRYRLPPKQVEERIRAGTLDLPPDIQEYVLESFRPLEGSDGDFFGALWNGVVSLVRRGISGLQNTVRRLAGSKNRPAADPPPETSGSRLFRKYASAKDSMKIRRIIEYIEDELEVQHDNAGR